MRGIIGAIGLLVLGVAAAVSSAPVAAAVFTATLHSVPISSSFYVVKNAPGYSATGGFDGITVSRTAAAPDGYVSVYSRYTVSGAFRVAVDAANLSTGTSGTAESGLSVNDVVTGAGGDIFAYNDVPGYANNNAGFTELSVTSLGTGLDRLAIAGNVGSGRFRLGLFMLQEYAGRADDAVTFSNLSVTADSITADVPEPAIWGLMLGGFALTGAALRRRPGMHVVAA
jgi:hypothetical protein